MKKILLMSFICLSAFADITNEEVFKTIIPGEQIISFCKNGYSYTGLVNSKSNTLIQDMEIINGENVPTRCDKREVVVPDAAEKQQYL